MAHLLGLSLAGQRARAHPRHPARARRCARGDIIDATNLPEPVRDPREHASSGSPSDDGVTLKEAVAALEKRMIVRALERAHGNRSEAARQLGIGRPQLYAKLEEYGTRRRQTASPPRQPSPDHLFRHERAAPCWTRSADQRASIAGSRTALRRQARPSPASASSADNGAPSPSRCTNPSHSLDEVDALALPIADARDEAQHADAARLQLLDVRKSPKTCATVARMKPTTSRP